MARLVRCIEGHVYDADLNASCPQCAAASSGEPATATAEAASAIPATPAAAAPSSQQSSRPIKIAAAAVLGVAVAGGAWWMLSSRPSAPAPQKQADATPPAVPAKRVSPPPPTVPLAPPPVVNAAPKPVAAPALPQTEPLPPSLPSSALPANVRDLQNAIDASLAALGQDGQIEPSIIAMARYAYGAALINRQLTALGLPLIEQAATGGVARAAGALGHGYLTGAYGMRKDATQARMWLQRAAQAGEPGADFDLASVEFAERTPAGFAAARDYFLSSYLASHPETLELLRLAKSGNAQAIALFRDMKINYARMPPVLSVFYSTYGRKDPARTREQLKAFSGTTAEASYFLARMMWNGEGGPQDRRGAFPLFLRAAEAGYTTALAYVGAALLDGTAGVRSPYNAAAATVIAELYHGSNATPGVEPKAVYDKALQELTPQQAAALEQFRKTAARISQPAPNSAGLAHAAEQSHPPGTPQTPAGPSPASGKFSADAWRKAPLASPNWSREKMVRQFVDEFKAPGQQAFEMAPTGLDRMRVHALLGQPGHSDEDYDLSGGLQRISDEYRLSAHNDHMYQIEYGADRKVVGGIIAPDGCNLDLSSFSDVPTIPAAAIGKFVKATESGTKAALFSSRTMTIAQFEASVGAAGKHLSSSYVVGGMNWVGYEVWWRFDDGSHRYLTANGHVARNDWKDDKFGEETINGYSVVTLLPDCLGH